MKWLLSCLFLALTACSTVGTVVCDVETTAASGIAVAIASGLQCSNVSQIQSDLTSAMSAAGLCKTASQPIGAKKLMIPAPICSVIEGIVVNDIAPLALPAKWGCTAANAKSLLNTVVMTACIAL